MKQRTLRYCLAAVVLAAVVTAILGAKYSQGILPDALLTQQEEKPMTYYFGENTPPALKSDLQKYLNSIGFEESTIDSSQNTIAVSKIDDIPPFEDALNLYQIWVFTENFDDTFTTEQISTIGILEGIDSADLQSELTDSILGIENGVSLETNPTVSRVFLAPIEQLNSRVYTPLTSPTNFAFSRKPSEWGQNFNPLVSHIVIQSSDDNLDRLREELFTSDYLAEHYYRTELPSDDDFVTVIKTGTTVAGGPGWELCERTKGSLSYPIDNVKETLSSSDLTIISNESSFVPGCSQGAGTTAFCGKPTYLQNLLDLGTDIISLTGNHMCDYGKSAFSETLDTYTANGLQFFGAGKSSTEAWTPLYVETPAGTIAFIGINLMGPTGVIATEDSAGVAFYNEQLFSQAITEALAQADFIWVDTHLWPEYGTVPGADQSAISELASSLGASIVTGVSSHELQGMTFVGDTPVFYGLGNFLFDQMWSQETRQGLVLKVTLFEKTIIAIEVMPTILYDYCQPRFAQGEDKTELLDYFYRISTFPE